MKNLFAVLIAVMFLAVTGNASFAETVVAPNTTVAVVPGNTVTKPTVKEVKPKVVKPKVVKRHKKHATKASSVKTVPVTSTK